MGDRRTPSAATPPSSSAERKSLPITNVTGHVQNNLSANLVKQDREFLPGLLPPQNTTYGITCDLLKIKRVFILQHEVATFTDLVCG